MFDPVKNLIEAAAKIAAELSSDDPKVVARIERRRHILAASLRVNIRSLETWRAANRPHEQRDEDPNNTFRGDDFAGFAENH